MFQPKDNFFKLNRKFFLKKSEDSLIVAQSLVKLRSSYLIFEVSKSEP